MNENLTATASLSIDAPPPDVWKALTDPQAIKEFMFGATISTDWRPGSPITWRGEWQGTPYEDRGEIFSFEPERLLQYSHFSSASGLPDHPDHYQSITVELSEEGEGTIVTVTQEGNATHAARDHSERNWEAMLEGLKRHVEGMRRRNDLS